MVQTKKKMCGWLFSSQLDWLDGEKVQTGGILHLDLLQYLAFAITIILRKQNLNYLIET